MATLNLPIAITYETKGSTPIADLIAALKAADQAVQDAVLLFPSLIDGVIVEHSEVRLISLSQASPLKEALIAALVLAFQPDLQAEVPAMFEQLFGIHVSPHYDSLLTLVVMAVIFYGAAFLKDAALKTVESGPLREQLNAIIEELAVRTGKTPAQVKAILDARYNKPKPVQHLVQVVRGFFVPAQREGGVPIVFDKQRVERDVVSEVPIPRGPLKADALERYDPFSDVSLEIHAQDKDKLKTGWAAVPSGICRDRLKMRLVEPLSASDLWNKDSVRGDIVLVSRLTPDGYLPFEIHLTRLSG